MALKMKTTLKIKRGGMKVRTRVFKNTDLTQVLPIVLRVSQISCAGLETVDEIYFKHDPIEVSVSLAQPEAMKTDIRNDNVCGVLV
jgi:hypothetical protein